MVRHRQREASPVAFGSARSWVLELLRRRIISLELPPGAVLSENELSAELGVSRTPVRESLIVLRGEGLVEVVPQVGTFVALVDPERVAQAQFIREAVECASLQDLRLPVPEDGQHALDRNLAEQVGAAEAGEAEAFFRLDEEFHKTLLQIAGHGGAWSTVNSAKAHLDRARRLSLVDTRPLDALVGQHRTVAEAVLAGRIDAAVAELRSHLRAVFDDVATIRSARPELFSGSAPEDPPPASSRYRVDVQGYNRRPRASGTPDLRQK